MATATIYALSSVSGSVSSPNNALGAPDGTYTTDGNSSTSWSHVWAVSSLSGVPDSTQTVKLRVRKGSNPKNPSVSRITLRQGATVLFDDTASHTVSSTAGIDISNTVDGTAFDGSYSNLELTIETSGQGGSPSARNAIEIDSISLDANYVDISTPVTGDLVVTESIPDSLTANGLVLVTISGTLSVTESNDNLTADVSLILQGSLSISETGDDIFTSDASNVISGSYALTEPSTDSPTLSGSILIQGSVPLTESGSDTLASLGIILIQGSSSLSESTPDVFTASGTANLVIQGDLVITEPGGETFSASGELTVETEGDLSVTESSSDSATLDGQVIIQSTSMILTEPATSDAPSLSGKVFISGVLTVSESASDNSVVTGEVFITGNSTMSEAGSDVLSAEGNLTSNATISGYFALVEQTKDTFYGGDSIQDTNKTFALKLATSI